MILVVLVFMFTFVFIKTAFSSIINMVNYESRTLELAMIFNSELDFNTYSMDCYVCIYDKIIYKYINEIKLR